MIVDILVLAILFISVAIAFFRGFIREVLTIAGVVGGTAAAYFWGPILNTHMRGWLGVSDDPDQVQKLFDLIPYSIVSLVLSYGIIFIVVVITLSVISHILSESVRNIGLGAMDRTLGVVFGLVRGLVFIGILYLPLFALVDQETRDGWFEGSWTHTYVEMSAKFMHGLLPEDIGLEVPEEETVEKVNEAATQVIKDVTTDTQNGYNQEFREQMNRAFEQGRTGNTTEQKSYNE